MKNFLRVGWVCWWQEMIGEREESEWGERGEWGVRERETERDGKGLPMKRVWDTRNTPHFCHYKLFIFT